MSGPLLLRTWRWQWLRFALLVAAAVAWGWLIFFFYSVFSPTIREFVQGNPLMEQFSQFGSGDFFTVAGSATLGLQHPLAIAILAVLAVGSSATAIAGERQRGTLEVLLARPLSRRTAYGTILVALLVLVGLLVAAFLLGQAIGLFVHELTDEVEVAALPLVWLNGFLLWAAFTTFGLAVSVTFDRPGPAIGLSLAYLLANYFLEILGSLWTDAEWTQEYSLIHHFQPGEILSGNADPFDIAILAVAAALPVIYALIVFPRRDLPAPS
ncbi:MAG TPA: ABC transporter permease subunit [Candidatus Limnocylindria bacterium]|nr:ABC transporter permease subunit [Candidatus Limnocylindria bacterium]